VLKNWRWTRAFGGAGRDAFVVPAVPQSADRLARLGVILDSG
jgi:hypothetical protein